MVILRLRFHKMLAYRYIGQDNLLIQGSKTLRFIGRRNKEFFVNGGSQANQTLSPTLSSWTPSSDLCDIYSME